MVVIIVSKVDATDIIFKNLLKPLLKLLIIHQRSADAIFGTIAPSSVSTLA